MVFAGIAVQTDWSDGPSTWGAVSDFSTEFYLDTDVRWGVEGIITSSYIYNSTTVYSNSQNKYMLCDDFNGDGYDDLATGSNYKVMVFVNSPSYPGYQWEPISIATDAYISKICSSDIDGDGDVDIAGYFMSSGELRWWENTEGSGESWVAHVVSDTLDCEDLLLSDIDADGDIDLIVSSLIFGLMVIENTNSLGTLWDFNVVSNSYSCPTKIALGNFNGDTRTDVAGVYQSSDKVLWFENTGSIYSSWIEHNIDMDCDNAYLISAVDMNQDGDCDVVVASGVLEKLSWFQNADGLGTSWVENYMGDQIATGSQLENYDIDNDGDVDILSACNNTFPSWWENADGDGLNWILYEYPAIGYVAICAGDFDSDGQPDIGIGGAGSTPVVIWCRIDYTSCSLESSLLDTEDDPDWGDIDWTSTTPEGTEVGFQVRSSNSSQIGSMPAWSDTLWSPCSLESFLTDGQRYMQYRAVLETSDPNLTPILEDVSISWNPVETQATETVEIQSPVLYPMNPNPSFGSSVIRYAIPAAGSVRILVYDVSGRLMIDNRTDESAGGNHEIMITGISPGVYFCRMMADDYSASQRFVVIK